MLDTVTAGGFSIGGRHAGERQQRVAVAILGCSFNKHFFSFITRQRVETCQAPVEAFKKYRESCDPGGLFYTQYLRDLLGV